MKIKNLLSIFGLVLSIFAIDAVFSYKINTETAKKDTILNGESLTMTETAQADSVEAWSGDLGSLGGGGCCCSCCSCP